MARALALWLCLAALASGCGYQLVGAGGTPSTTLWVGPVGDESDEPLFGSHVRAALAREAVDRSDALLAPKERAGAWLSVKVASAKESTSAFVAGDKPRQYLVTAVVDATLTSRDGRVLWRDAALKADRQFSSGTTVEETENNKQVALRLLAGDLGREVMRRVSLTLLTVAPPK